MGNELTVNQYNMEKFCLNWNDFQQNASNAFNQLRNDKDLIDVTLVTEEGEHISAHKVVLSTSSDFFKDALKKANHQNPLIFLSGFDSKVLTAVLDYIYNGEVNLFQDDIDTFLDSAQKLKIHGLTQKLEENKGSTFVENDVNSRFCDGGSNEMKENENFSATHVQDNHKVTTVSKIDSSNGNVKIPNNYDELITKCEVGCCLQVCFMVDTLLLIFLFKNFIWNSNPNG